MSLTFKDVAALWKAEKRLYVKRSSYAIYVHLLNRHLLPRFAAHSRFAPEDIQSLVNDHLAAGLSVKTIRDELLVLRMVLRFGASLQAWQPVDCHPRFPTTAGRRRELPLLTMPQQKRLLRYLGDNFSFRNLGLLICLHSGLRIGEVCGLQWKDLDVGAGEIHVRKTVSRLWLRDGDERAYELQIGTPKTPSSVRDIPFTKELAAVIRPLRKVMNPEYFVASNAAAPLEPRYYRDYFHKLLRKLDIPPVRFHAPRHSFATRCIESRCDYKTVSVLLGHSSISTTLDLYVHPGHDEKKKCIERMWKGLGK